MIFNVYVDQIINVIIANLSRGIRFFVSYIKSETDEEEGEKYEAKQKPFKNKFINLNIRDRFFFIATEFL